ncbi:hypothetical protein [Nannocystis pusilla]|uniref:hypothetical protein n=1 Tax=Nannocystis pusilla TaxID=889268 RepID=UPI003B7E240C
MTTPWSDRIPKFEDDTMLLLETSLYLLQRYFAHDKATAEDTLVEFIGNSGWDENFYHHEGPYRTAAIAHYRHYLKGDPSSWFDWLREYGHLQTPRSR